MTLAVDSPGTDPSAAAGEVLLACRGLLVGHDRRALLPPIDVRIARGTVLAVIGRNGAGKTTWTRTMLGLRAPLGGSIERRFAPGRVAYLAQSAGIDPLLALRVDDFVAWGRLHGLSFARPRRGSERALCHEALRRAGAADLAGKLLRDLSAGQRQRVLFARLLVSDAEVAFLDEPTSAMDAIAEREVFDELRLLTRERAISVVVVSHMLSLAAQKADQVLYLDRDDQQVLCGPPAEILTHPLFCRRFGRLELSDGQ
jgi:zinc transport system ATP-binding protein